MTWSTIRFLLSVLRHNFGLEDTVLNWFDSYLHPRKCKVSIGKEYSSKQNPPFSVPQGSCAGAQIFSLYCSIIQEVINPPLNLHRLVDGHTVENKFKPGHCDDEVRCMCELEKCAVDLKVWMDENQLNMNNDKSEFILFGSKPQLDKCITKFLNINNTEIKLADKIKYLGVLLDRQLNLKQHIVKLQCSIFNVLRTLGTY